MVSLDVNYLLLWVEMELTTIICVHQPGPDIFALVDKIYIINANEDKTFSTIIEVTDTYKNNSQDQLVEFSKEQYLSAYRCNIES